MPVEAAVERREEGQNMYVTKRETANTRGSCVSPCEAPARQHDPDEVGLIDRLHASDHSAFHEIVDRYATRIYRVAYGIVRDPEAADEIAQEVFAKVYFSIPGFGVGSSLYLWIYRFAVNECCRYLLRHRLVYSRDSSSEKPAIPAGAVAQRRPASDRTVMRSNLLNTLLAHIPEDDRWLLVLREVEGASLSELSQMTGLNEDEIKTKLLLVRQRLIAAADELKAKAGPATI
jgi:RNA polymerase sigma-70 factor (ECF subfamily)